MRLIFNHNICKATEYSGQEVQYIQQKYDGNRVTVLRQPPGTDYPIVFYTRSQSDLYPELASKAHHYDIWQWVLNLLRIPPYSSIDGELYVPGKPASYVKTAIKEADPGLKFAAFAFPWLERQRRYTDPLEWAMEQCSAFGVSFIPFIKLDRSQVIDVDEWRKKIRPEVEGWVVKKFHYTHWYKIKRIRTIDLIVTGFVPGNGKYEGMMGSLRCSAYDQFGELREICLCSGMTDEERVSFSEGDIGRVCEVKFQEVASLGRLRHPNFVRWREEKQPFECTLAQEPELLRYWGNI